MITSAYASRLHAMPFVAIVIAAFVPFAAHDQTKPAATAPRADVSLRLDWIPTWYHAPFYHALDQGYYRNAGLNLSIGQGKGSATTAQVVGAGSETFGLMDMSIMTLAAGSGAPLKAIGGYIQRSPDAAVFLTTSNIRSPKDLEGKRWGYSTGSSSETLFPLFAAKTGIDESKIVKITMDPGAKLAFLLAGRIDLIADWGATVDPLIVAQGKTPGNFVYADYGVFFIARALVTTTTMISAKPDIVKAFLAATVNGIEDAIKNPTTAVDAFIAHQPAIASNREQLIAQMRAFGEFLHSKSTAGRPTLWMASEDVASTLDAARQLGTAAANVQLTNLFTNEFLPRQ
jgi:NitT/TauT family transport system substrate-binding protein